MIRRMLVAMTALFSASVAYADGCWTQKADFPFEASREPFSVSTATALYVGNTSFNDSFYRYNASKDLWISLADLPGSFPFQAPGFDYGGRPYAVMGTQLWRYNPGAKTWTYQGATPTSDMRAAFAIRLNGKVYLGGGFYNREKFWRYDLLGGKWTQLADLPPDLANCIGCSGFTLPDGKIYVTGTNTGFWRYDPRTAKWTPRAYIRSTFGNAFAISGRGYMLDTFGNLSTYNSASDSWKKVTTFPGTTVCYPAVLVANGAVIVAFGGILTDQGCTLDVSNEVWQWSPTQTCSP